jgi:hypothetical protein
MKTLRDLWMLSVPMVTIAVALCCLATRNSPRRAPAAIQPHRTIHVDRATRQALASPSESSAVAEDAVALATAEFPEPDTSWPCGAG